MNMSAAVTPRIRVGILGATGSVGQKFVTLLHDHPWFEVTAVAASDQSAGRPYASAAHWMQPEPLPEHIGRMTVQPCVPELACRIVFSGLDASVAGEIETAFARAGYLVVSNARNHRMDPDVPLLIPEVNPDHLRLLQHQAFDGGGIVTNPNCSTTGLVLALKPLRDAFGLEAVQVVTMQAISGAGYPGVASQDILDNVIPYIAGEEDKLEREPRKILGTYTGHLVDELPLTVSAQCNRVAVQDGHLECVSVRLRRPATRDDIIASWEGFRAEPQHEQLPTAPLRPLYYFDEPRYPQPKLHRGLERGMAVSIGRLQPCPILDWKFVVLSHNTIRGAAGGAILNAELLVRQGWVRS